MSCAPLHLRVQPAPAVTFACLQYGKSIKCSGIIVDQLQNFVPDDHLMKGISGLGSAQIKRWASDRPGWAITSLYMTASNFQAAPTGASTITRFLKPKSAPGQQSPPPSGSSHPAPSASAQPVSVHLGEFQIPPFAVGQVPLLHVSFLAIWNTRTVYCVPYR